MPNWCYNNVTIEGKIKDILTKDADGNDTFTFNSVVPMPPSLDMETGSSNDEDILMYLTNGLKIPLDELPREKYNLLVALVSNMFTPSREWLERIWEGCEKRIPQEDIPKHIKTGQQLVNNYWEYGAITWYDWCNKNWGTKWDACNVEVISNNEIYFETAWCPPEEVLKALSLKFPDTLVVCDWEEEGGESGIIFYKNGDWIQEVY